MNEIQTYIYSRYIRWTLIHGSADEVALLTEDRQFKQTLLLCIEYSIAQMEKHNPALIKTIKNCFASCE